MENTSTFNNAYKLTKKGDNNRPYCNILKAKFYVLKDLVADVFINKNSLKSLNMFTKYLDDLICSSLEILEMLNIYYIVLLRPVGQRVNQLKEYINS